MKYYITEAEDGKVLIGEIKEVEGEEKDGMKAYTWVDSEDGTNNFLATLVSFMVHHDGELVLVENEAPKFKITMSELTPEEAEAFKKKQVEAGAKSKAESKTE